MGGRDRDGEPARCDAGTVLLQRAGRQRGACDHETDGLPRVAHLRGAPRGADTVLRRDSVLRHWGEADSLDPGHPFFPMKWVISARPGADWSRITIDRSFWACYVSRC